jgi:hypothetical protein
MKLQLGFIALWVAMVVAQAGQMLDCTEDVIQSEECSEVISPVACYNQFRWNTQTLSCIKGTDAEKRAKVRVFSSPSLLRFFTIDSLLWSPHSLFSCERC